MNAPEAVVVDPARAEARAQVAELVRRARAAQRIADGWSQSQADEAVVAAGWAVIEPGRNRALAERAVADTGIGNVADKIAKNHRKTLGLLRDLKGAKTVGVISEDPARGLVEIARPVGVVCAVTPSTNPAATPANKIINALAGRNAVIVAPSPKGWSTCDQLIGYIHAQLDRIGAPRRVPAARRAPRPRPHRRRRGCSRTSSSSRCRRSSSARRARRRARRRRSRR